MERGAAALWTLGLKNGKGSLSTRSGALRNTQYNFKTCFEDRPGTNPEELIAAAHAGCFTMTLAATLEASGMHPESIHTCATITLEQVSGELTPTSPTSITSIHLDVAARIPGADKQAFDRMVNLAQAACAVSRLLNTRIIVSAKLVVPDEKPGWFSRSGRAQAPAFTGVTA